MSNCVRIKVKVLDSRHGCRSASENNRDRENERETSAQKDYKGTLTPPVDATLCYHLGQRVAHPIPGGVYMLSSTSRDSAIFIPRRFLARLARRACANELRCFIREKYQVEIVKTIQYPDGAGWSD